MAPSEPISLTYLITGLQYGGANIGMVRLLSELDPDEYDITVVSVADTSPDIVPLLPDHASICTLKIDSRLPSVTSFRHLFRTLRSTDILVCSLFHATIVGVLLDLLFRVPTVLVWQHSSEYSSDLRQRLYSIFYRRADRVLADSEAVREMLIETQQVPDADISVLPIAGVDMETFRPYSTDSTSDRVVVGTIGRLVEQKGYPELFETAERLGDRFQFRVIGDGDKFEQYERQAPENVELLGRVNDESLPQQLASSDIYFQPSRHEGLCMTVIEAMACGLPVVGSAVGGITESVVDGETGLLCEPQDIECFCESLSYLAEHPDEAAAMGMGGRERVKNQYSADALVTAFERVVSETHGTK